MKKVSDIITQKEISKWSNNDVITIEAGTGVGKSYFIKNILYEIAKEENKKILMLLHREKTMVQFVKEIEKDNKQDVIDIKTYQSIEYTLLNNKEIDVCEYKYVVCDEFHYMIGDSAFNSTTDMSFNFISKLNCVRIFMSATCDGMLDFLNDNIEGNIKSYSIPIKFNFIKRINFFNRDKTIEELIEKFIKKNKKAIIFLNSAEQCYNLYNKFKNNSLFCCGKSSKFYKYVNEEEINNMLINECFDKNILITTTCLDAGVNIIDDRLTEIICDVNDVNVMKQCIGRKRLQSSKDKITLYIKDVNKNVLGGRLVQLEKKRKKAEYLMSHTVDEYIVKFNRDTNDVMIYDVVDKDGNTTKEVNKLMLAKALLDSVEIEDMIEIGYRNYICNALKYTKSYGMIESDKKSKELNKYLNKLVGKKLFKEEQKELKNVFINNGLKSRTLGINTLSGYLKDIKSTYDIIAKKSNGKRYWIVIDDIDR